MVAQEVRVLAQRAAQAAKQIKQLIAKSTEEVKTGVALVGETGTALEAIIGDVEEIDKNVTAIVEASREQSTGLGEINTAVGTIDQGTQQNAAMVEQTSSASVNLAQQAEDLNALLATFRLGRETIASAKPVEPRPGQETANGPAFSRAGGGRQRFANHGSAALAVQTDNWQEF